MLATRFASHSPALRSDYPLSDDQIRRVAPSTADRTASARAQARSWKPGRRRQPSEARERWKPEGAKPRRGFDAQHDSATSHLPRGRGRPGFSVE